jgi:hypothetical protein
MRINIRVIRLPGHQLLVAFVYVPAGLGIRSMRMPAKAIAIVSNGLTILKTA